jgi:hypothetical protein
LSSEKRYCKSTLFPFVSQGCLSLFLFDSLGSPFEVELALI